MNIDQTFVRVFMVEDSFLDIDPGYWLVLKKAINDELSLVNCADITGSLCVIRLKFVTAIMLMTPESYKTGLQLAEDRDAYREKCVERASEQEEWE